MGVRGFGYITMDDGEDAMVYSNNLQGVDALDVGDRVEFEVTVNPKNGKIGSSRDGH